MKRFLAAMLLLIGPPVPRPYAATIEIAASIVTDKTLACKSAGDCMRMIDHLKANNLQAVLNDEVIYNSTGRCIDLEKGQNVFIVSDAKAPKFGRCDVFEQHPQLLPFLG